MIKFLRSIFFSILLFVLLFITLFLPTKSHAQTYCPNTCGCGCEDGICRICDPPPPQPGGCTGGNQCPGGCCIGEVCQSGAICNNSCPANYSINCTPWPANGNLACSTVINNCPFFNSDPSKCITWCYNGLGGLDVGTGQICENSPTYNFKKNCSLCFCQKNCDLTPPIITSIDINSLSSVNVNWTLGTGAGTLGIQTIYVGTNESEVNANCPGISSPACIVNKDLANNIPTFNIGSLVTLDPSTVYHVKVVNYKNSSCKSGSEVKSFLSSCYITPIQVPLATDDEQLFTMANIYDTSAKISQVNFSSSNTAVAIILPLVSDSSAPYQATAKAVGTTAGSSSNIIGNVIIPIIKGWAPTCNPGQIVLQNTPGGTPWWQVWDGDVVTNGSIGSTVPSSNYFDLNGVGGFPGVPIYGSSFNLSATPSLISLGKMWQVNSPTSFARRFDYDYFNSLIPSTISPAPISNLVAGTTKDSNGYEWFKTSGITPINALNLTGGGNRKIILFVDGDLRINGNITLDDGLDFFGVFVSGRITINQTVTNIEGIYLTNTDFVTGNNNNTKLHVRGSVASYGDVHLQRNLANNTPPAEEFEFAPDQLLLFPSALGYSRIKWTEVAP